MKSNISKMLVGGVVGTLMMSLMMKLAAPMLIGQPLDLVYGGFLGVIAGKSENKEILFSQHAVSLKE